MSRFIIALIIFSLILAGSISAVVYVNVCENELQRSLDVIASAVQKSDMEKAAELSRAFVKRWEEIEPYIIMLVRHHSIDEITKNASVMTAYCACGSEVDAMAEISLIKSILKHISEDEKPVFHNFL